MIRTYNCIQILLAPVHALIGVLAGLFTIGFVDSLVGYIYENFDLLITGWMVENRPKLRLVCFGTTFVVTAILAFRIWSRSQTSLPGILSAVPRFDSNPIRRASYGEIEIVSYSALFRILGNLFLCCPLQFLFALQRFRNLIPDTSTNRKRIENAYQYAAQRTWWHPITDYDDDSDAIDYLIRMRKVSYSPTKSVVKVK